MRILHRVDNELLDRSIRVYFLECNYGMDKVPQVSILKTYYLLQCKVLSKELEYVFMRISRVIGQ